MRRGSKLILAGTLALLCFFGAGATWLLGILGGHPDFTLLRSKVTIKIKLADKSDSTRVIGPAAPGWARMKEISNHLLMAVISSEDTSFFSHEGIDYHELKEALKRDIEEKRWARGASTLTQQVVKNVWLSQEKTIVRKVRELMWARQLDKTLSKSEILCFYVNMAEWGPGLYGIKEAARHYFEKEPGELTAKESAFLAILLPSPWRYHAYFTKKELTRFALGRIEHVLRVMNRMGYLDDAEYAAARREPLWGVTGVLDSPLGKDDPGDGGGTEELELAPDGDSPGAPAPSTALPSEEVAPEKKSSPPSEGGNGPGEASAPPPVETPSP